MNKTATIVIVCLLAFVVIPVATVVGLYISNNDAAVAMEEQITAQYDKDENALAQLSLKAVEMMQIADAAKNDAIEIITAAMKGKYGDSGATAQFLWSNDGGFGNILDPSLRKEVMHVIAGGRTNFEQSQNVRIDKCRQYETELRTAVGGGIKRLIGFPQIDMEKYCTIVSSAHAKKAFETKVDEGIKLQ